MLALLLDGPYWGEKNASKKPLPSPQASATHGGLGNSGKHHPRLEAVLPPSDAPNLHPSALSPADVALFPTSPGAAEGS